MVVYNNPPSLSLLDAHADHITGTGLLKQKIPGVKSVISEASKAKADVKINAGDRITFGSRHIQARATPGHTCLLYTSPSPRDKRQSRMPSSA